MTFNPAAAITIDRIVKKQNLSNVVEIGNQRYTAQRVFPADSTKDFYEKRGLKYHAIDVNTERDSIIMDMNYDLKEKYGFQEQFDLVTNIGTTEHIFNQYSCFRNIHNLCRNYGLIYHQLPFTPWINHGLYNYNPIFFSALAYANNYEIVELTLCDREWNKIGSIVDSEMFKEKRPLVLEKELENFSRNTFINIVFKKTQGEFKMPFQGKYLKDIESDDLKQEYKANERFRAVS